MQDETTFTPKPEPPKKPTETVSTETTTTSTVTGPKKDETMLLGASGRFWITFVMAFGLLELPTLYLLVVIFGRTVDATIFLGIFTAYIGVAGMGIGTYLGQNKPKPN